MIRLAIVGLGKMGLSHYSIINTHPNIELAAICDSAGYVLDVLNKYTGVRTYTDFDTMLREVALDAVNHRHPIKYSYKDGKGCT